MYLPMDWLRRPVRRLLHRLRKPYPPQATPEPEKGAVAPIWLQRTSLFVLVLFCVYLGVLVTILPWWSKIWDHNLYFQSRPALAAVLRNGAVRGLISAWDCWIYGLASRRRSITAISLSESACSKPDAVRLSAEGDDDTMARKDPEPLAARAVGV